MKNNLARRAVGEFLGTAMLLSTVVGSGIMAERLSDGNIAIALLANTVATGAILIALILTFGQLSGAHFNPAVTVSDAINGGLKWKDVLPYILAQTLGAVSGVGVANAMFDLPIFFVSQKVRTGFSQLLGEFIASFGLLAIIWGCVRLKNAVIVPFGVAAYITAAYWFTSSTSFANPSVTLARSLSDTFAGIRPVDVPMFMVAQLLGALTATVLFRWLLPELKETQGQEKVEVVTPHED